MSTAHDTSAKEAARLQELADLEILDTVAEEAFDRLTELAATFYQAPIALISLVDEKRQWFKSRIGLDAQETARNIAFCHHAIEQEDVYIVHDAMENRLFRDNPLVTADPNIRFYAGAPLTTGKGLNLGTLCIIDRHPRPDFCREDARQLELLADIVVREMDTRKHALTLQRALDQTQNSQDDYVAVLKAEIEQRLASQTELSELNSLMDCLLNSAPDGMLVLDLSGKTLIYNKAFCETWQIPEESVHWMLAGGLFQVSDALLEKTDDFAINILRALGRGERTSWREIALKDGRFIEENTRPLYDKDKRLCGRMWYFRDVTTRIASENQLMFAANLFATSPEAMALLNQDLHITQINKTLQSRLGYDEVEIVGHDMNMFESGRQDGFFYAEIKRALLEEGHWEGEIWNRAKNGALIAHKMTLAPAHEGRGQKEFIAVFSDISEAKLQMDQLRHLANHDPLTGLPNRSLLQEIIQTQIDLAERRNLWVAVIMVDLDGFKPINDTLGHQAGDEILCHVAQSIENALREADRVFRLGGDEFVISAICSANRDALESLCNRVLDAISTPLDYQDQTLCVRGSIGVAVAPHHGTKIDSLIDRADQAMYVSKEAGKARITIAPLTAVRLGA